MLSEEEEERSETIELPSDWCGLELETILNFLVKEQGRIGDQIADLDTERQILGEFAYMVKTKLDEVKEKKERGE